MKLFEKTTAMLVAMALLGVMAFAIYYGVRAVGATVTAMTREGINLPAVAALIALLATWMIARGVRAATRQSPAAAFRDEKAATYQLLLDFWVNRIQRRGQPSAELDGQLIALDRLLALYGNAAVMAAHTAMRDRMRGHGDEVLPLAGLLIAVRRDLGSDTPPGIAADLDRLLFPRADAAGVGEAVPA